MLSVDLLYNYEYNSRVQQTVELYDSTTTVTVVLLLDGNGHQQSYEHVQLAIQSEA